MPEDRKSVSNYPSNRNGDAAKKTEPPWDDSVKQAETPSKEKAERVTKSDPVERKKPLGKRIAETFSGDDMHSVGQYILFEVFIPAAKSAISDAVSQGVERLMYGETRPAARSHRVGGYTAYNRVGASPRREEPRALSQRSRATHDFREIVLESRGEAEQVIQSLADRIGVYDVATVSDLYDMVGITGSFTDARYGWTDLRMAGVTRVREGYLVNLPRPIEIP